MRDEVHLLTCILCHNHACLRTLPEPVGLSSTMRDVERAAVPA